MTAKWLISAALLAALSLGSAGLAQAQTLLASQSRDGAFAAGAEAPRWRRPLCVGVTGLNQDNAQYIIDRIGQRAGELGLSVGASGCTANLLVVFTADAAGQARSLAEERTDPASRTGRLGATSGRSAFEDFLATDRPIRWWRVSRRANAVGQNASRDERMAEPPSVHVDEVGRLGQSTFPVVSHAIVIADLAQVNGVRLGALADYIALTALGEVDASADTSGADTILNLFAARGAGRAPPDGLTSADLAYLRALYGRR